MRCGLVLAVLGLGLLGGLTAGHADERDMALGRIDRAIEAHGGAGALTRAQTAVRRGRGVMALADRELAFTDELKIQVPDRLRLVLDVGEGDGKQQTTVVINGDKGWQLAGGAARDLAAERVKELREEVYLHWLKTLVPLKKDAAFQLGLLPDITGAGGQTLLGVKISHRDHGDVNFYFDKGSGLLARVERQVRIAGLTLQKDLVLSNHKAFGGARLAGREVETVNGKKFTDVTFTDYRFIEKLDEGTFARP